MTSETPPPLPLDTAGPSTAPFGSVAAASVIAECLRVQREVPARSVGARIFGRSPLSSESRPWYVGALGELDVARRLESLGDTWTVLHSVPIGTRGSDIDHIVVGRAGVVTINTKFHDDAKVWVGSHRLLINGQRTDHLRNARYEADRVRKQLANTASGDIPVRAAVVIVGAKEVTLRQQPADVTVLRAAELVPWLRRQKPTLDIGQTIEVAAIMSRRDTWTAEDPAAVDELAFASLQREVRRAKGVRMAWGAGLLLATIGIAAPFALDFYAQAFGG